MLIDATSRAVIAPGISARLRAERTIGAFVARYSNKLTRSAYLHDLKAWLRFLDEVGVDDPINDVGRQHFDVLMRQLEAEGRMPATIARRIGTVSLWYEYLVDEDQLDKNPARRIKRPSVPNVSSTPWLTRRQLSDWLDAGEKLGGYDAAVCMILGLNGLRVGELCSLNIASYEQVDYHHVISFIGKGGKPATVPLPPRAVFALAKVLEGRTTGPMILNRYGNRITRENVALTVTRIAKAARIEKHISPHSIRHSAVTAALDSGIPMRDVQNFARHTTSATTSRYDRGGDNLNRNAAYALAQALAG